MRLLIWLLLIYIGYRIVQGFLKERKPAQPPLPPRGADTHRDPVCGIYVAEEDAIIGRVDDKRFYFCSRECLEKYREQLEHR